MSEKNQVLDEIEEIFTPKKFLDLNYFLIMLLIMTFAMVVTFPKIYLQEQIYFKSRDIHKLSAEYETLKEEHKIISASVESIKFKNQILDTLF